VKVQLHGPAVLGHGREETLTIHTSAPHVYFCEDGGAELRWSASDEASHTHPAHVRVRIGAKEAEALRALVRRKTRAHFGQSEDEPPPPRQVEHATRDPRFPDWTPPDEPHPDGKEWEPPSVDQDNEEEHETS